MALILIVDDDAAVRDSIAAILGLDGHELAEAADGHQCEREVQRRTPDLVILDIFMPGKEGIETIRSLRRWHRDLKILAISGGGDSHLDKSLHYALEFGANATLPKPFLPGTLRNIVRALLASNEA
ncbi:MAG TPA: response regulator [Alphaproteobacteria bacterium]